MSNNASPQNTDIPIIASQKDIINILAAQYAHMTTEEAKEILARTNNQVWSNDELLELFEVSHFDPPYVHVIQKDNGMRGTVAFIDKPRLYFAFQPETNDARTP